MSKYRSVLKVKKEEIKPEMFENKKSYEYFMTLYYEFRWLELLRKQGAIIFMDGEPMDKKEFFSFGINDDGTMPRLGTSTTNNSMTVYCGFTYGNKPNTVFVYKKEINEALKNITYVEKKDIKKFTIQKYSFQ